MFEQKAAVMVGTKSRITIPKRLFDAIRENGGFEKNAYLVLETSIGKKFYQYPVNRISLPFFNKGDVLVISYDPFKGAYFKIVECHKQGCGVFFY